jgi:hypothetical protein
LGRSAGIGPCDEEVALVVKAEVDAPVKLVEERDAFSDQLDLFRVAELQPKGSGRHRGGQGRQGGAPLHDDRLQSGSLGEEGRRATDDAPADHDEVGGVGR